jgi:hypothetical protein
MLPKEPRLHNLGKQPSTDSRLHRTDLRLQFADLRSGLRYSDRGLPVLAQFQPVLGL